MRIDCPPLLHTSAGPLTYGPARWLTNQGLILENLGGYHYPEYKNRTLDCDSRVSSAVPGFRFVIGISLVPGGKANIALASWRGAVFFANDQFNRAG